MLDIEKVRLREGTIFWAAVTTTAAALLLLAERWFLEGAAEQAAAGSVIFIGACWAVYGIYRMISRYSTYSMYTYAPALAAFFLLLVLINPFSGANIHIYMLLFPPALALGVTLLLYSVWAGIFLLAYAAYILSGTGFQETGGDSLLTYFLLPGLSVFIGGVIVIHLQSLLQKFHTDVIYEKNTYLLQVFRTLIPTVEARTQIKKNEIDDMSILMSRTEKYMEEPLFEKWEVELISMAHYVSRIQLPDYLYEKRGKLSKYEQRTVQEHCRFAADLIPHDEEMKRIKQTLEQHHERKDGSGYPHGLRGKEITQGAQLLGLTESFLSLTQDRIYRGAFSPEDAAAKLAEEAENLFEKKLVEAFLQCLKEEKYLQSSGEDQNSSTGSF
ncbi:MAG: hypothetical protein EA344_02575 [Alkalicoccus sp.]|nr:MAG: hypothetical protein EA344_02575 [Alkalicoccus sp.]